MVGGPPTLAPPLWRHGGGVGRPSCWYIPLCHDSGLSHTTWENVKTNSLRRVTAVQSRCPCVAGLGLGAQIGNDPVAVAAVDRAHELDRVAVCVAREALEQKRRRVKRHPQRGRLVRVGDGWLDRLHPVGDNGPV